MNTKLLYLISSDADWAGRLDGLVRDERLGGATHYPMGKGALSGYRTGLPEVVIFDLRQDRRDIAVVMTMIREIYPRMASGGVVVIGSADPADREALRQERDQLARIQLAEYLPRNTPDEFVLERVAALHRRALESGRAAAPPSAPVTPPAPGPAAPPPDGDEPPAGTVTAAEREFDARSFDLDAPAQLDEDIPCAVKLMLSTRAVMDDLLRELRDLGAESLEPNSIRTAEQAAALPDFLIVDGAGAEQHASFLTKLHRLRPGLRIIQLPENGEGTLRRLSRDISALMRSPDGQAESARLAELIRGRVARNGGRAVESAVLLLVEDEQNIRELTAHYLLLQGYEVYQAEDGEEAMTVFRARRPDLVLSDVYMPRMNGFKLLLQVRNWAPDLPMLMMTGYSSAAQVLNTSKYPNVAFLPKPFRLSELGERIREMLGGGQ